MSNLPRLQLKQPTGWFAAGREVAEALVLLLMRLSGCTCTSCLNADRHTGRLAIDAASLARMIRREPATIEDDLGALSRHNVVTDGLGSWRSATVSGRITGSRSQLRTTARPTTCGRRGRPFWSRHAFVQRSRRRMKSSPPISTGAVCRWRM